MEVAYKSLAELAEGLREKQFSSVELTKYFLDRIRKYDEELKSFITVTEEEAMEQAKSADKRLAKGEVNPFLGIPYAAKDLFLTEGVRTTAASKILEDFRPVYDATTVAKLRQAGSVLVGKTNLDEFAHGSSTETSYFGPSHNPWDVSRMPGGSSGGSAAAVAAGLVPFALGTETGGSIRQPASLCGISGWKPTYGRVSRYGVIAMTSSTDSIGSMTRSAHDLAMTAELLSGKDPHDGTTSDKPVDEWSKLVPGSLEGIRIGIPKEYFIAGIEEDVEKRVREAIKELEKLGAKVVDVSLPLTSYGSLVYAIVTPSEISSNLSRYDGIRFGYSSDQAKDLFEVYSKSRGEGFGDEVKRRIMTGAYALSAGYRDQYYLHAQRVRRLIVNEFEDVFKEVDALICPSTPNVAQKIGGAADNPLFGYIADQLNIPGALAGVAAASVPCGFGKPEDDDSTSLPVGLQIMGPQWGEKIVFQIAMSYQNVTDFHKQIPKGY